MIMARCDDYWDRFLHSTQVLDWKHPSVTALAARLAAGAQDDRAVARRCFEWVRDEIRHSRDYQMNPVTCAASEVLQAGTGYCYAKSHLLAAVLRANRLPAGLCYQRLSRDENGSPYCLHGLVAVWLQGVGWYRMDPRGNRPGIDAQFTPPREKLAFQVRLAGEADLPEVWPEPLSEVTRALRKYPTYDALWEDLPDVSL
jgi:transglutaminase-like putative cysteine protease